MNETGTSRLAGAPALLAQTRILRRRPQTRLARAAHGEFEALAAPQLSIVVQRGGPVEPSSLLKHSRRQSASRSERNRAAQGIAASATAPELAYDARPMFTRVHRTL